MMCRKAARRRSPPGADSRQPAHTTPQQGHASFSPAFRSSPGLRGAIRASGAVLHGQRAARPVRVLERCVFGISGLGIVCG